MPAGLVSWPVQGKGARQVWFRIPPEDYARWFDVTSGLASNRYSRYGRSNLTTNGGSTLLYQDLSTGKQAYDLITEERKPVLQLLSTPARVGWTAEAFEAVYEKCRTWRPAFDGTLPAQILSDSVWMHERTAILNGALARANQRHDFGRPAGA